jgi:SAP domain-containing ribonucleoprotein
MVDYAKKTVAELQEILKSRSLSHTGKKAELIARLTEADKEAESNGIYSPLALMVHQPPLP